MQTFGPAAFSTPVHMRLEIEVWMQIVCWYWVRAGQSASQGVQGANTSSRPCQSGSYRQLLLMGTKNIQTYELLLRGYGEAYQLT